MEVGEVREALLELLDEVRELRHGIVHAHVLVPAPRAQPDRRLPLADGGNDGVHELKREPRTILDRTAVRVRTRVGDVLQELVGEIAVRAVDLDAVEASPVDGAGGSLAEPADVVLNFYTARDVGKG